MDKKNSKLVPVAGVVSLSKVDIVLDTQYTPKNISLRCGV
jgi:hypothetical protein